MIVQLQKLAFRGHLTNPISYKQQREHQAPEAVPPHRIPIAQFWSLVFALLLA